MAKHEVTVELVGHDGNAFAILGRVSRELKRFLRAEGWTSDEIKGEVDAYMAEATSGDYDHLLATTMEWVEVT